MRLLRFAILLLAITAASFAQAPQTQVVILGTGIPRPIPERSGPSVCIAVGDTAYLVDFGPGVVRRAAEAARKGIAACNPNNLKIAFSTHLHSDHTAGLSDLYLTPAVMARHAPLVLYGPAGLADMARHIREAYAKDFQVRTEGLERGDPKAYQIVVHEIQPGVAYKDGSVTVTAFPVKHGSWDQAFGYRFDTPGRSIVVAGDTAPADSVAQVCHGCDLLLHEVYSDREYVSDYRPDWQKYLRAFHTSAAELGAIATKAHPGLLVLYHQVIEPQDTDEELVREVQATYKGKAVSAHDLYVF